jgi:hypothetical protein
MVKFYETVGGSEEYIGSRPIIFPHVANPAAGGSAVVLSEETMRVAFEFCWHEGGRLVVVAPTATIAGDSYTLIWPCSVVGGNSFRIEPGYDMQVHEGDWRYHLIEHPELGAYAVLLNPGGCNCSTYNCLTCKGEWGDTMLITNEDGPYAGQTVVVDRFRDYSTTDDGRSFGYPLNYWQFYYVPELNFPFGPADPDGEDWMTWVYFCEGNNDPDTPFDSDRTTGGRLQMTYYGGFPGVSGDELFDTEDCEGPYTALMNNQAGGTVTVSITPNAP